MKKKIVEILVVKLDRHSQIKSKEDKEKIQYILSVLIGEASKVLLLLLIFCLLNRWREYLVSLFVVLITRSFAGGSHENNSFSCLIHSFVFFATALALSTYCFNSMKFFLVFFITIITYWLYAPIVSSVRGIFNENKKRKLRLLSIVGVLISWGLAVVFYGIRNVVVATVFVELMEFFYILKVRR